MNANNDGEKSWLVTNSKANNKIIRE